jgi:hypothetical protein
MLRSLLNVACVLWVMVAPGIAQRGGGHNGFPVLSPSAPRHGGFGPQGEHRRPFPGSFFLGTPLWADDYYSYYPEQPPSNYVVQAPPKTLEYPKPLAPLMIELQGDQYVRRTLDESRSSPPESPANASVARASLPGARPSSARQNFAQPSVSAPSPVSNEAPTVFVFRDGHREESSDYSIISGVIYSRGDYWTSGSWSKKILIADLDVPATLQANRERGVQFRLPSAPNEVITRP